MTLTLLWQGLSGALFGIVVFYLLGSLLAARFLRLDAYELLLSMAVGFFVAIICEVFLGQLYTWMVGKPLWVYRVWPIHGGYTSALNFIVWPVYGYYWYITSLVMNARGLRFRRHWHKGLLTGIDGPLLEMLANGFFLSLYATFYFYYLPDDLWHFTSVQVIPLYMLMGISLSFLLATSMYLANLIKHKYNVHMNELEFEWDKRKETANVRKHGVSFEEARTAFYDEGAIQFYEPDHSDQEDRFILLGLSLKPQVLVVCHCVQESETVVRIISARKADKDEERVYWEWRK